MPVTTRSRVEASTYAYADGTIEVSLWKVTRASDGRGGRHGDTQRERLSKFTLTVSEAAILVREVTDAMAFGYKNLAAGKTNDEEW